MPDSQRPSSWRGGPPPKGHAGPSEPHRFERDARGRAQEPRQQYILPTSQEISDILKRDGAVMVSKAQELAKALQGLKTAQLRNFYGSLLLIEARYRGLPKETIATELLLLRPKLHYMVNRPQGSVARSLQQCFDALLSEAAKRIKEANDDESARAIAHAVFEFAEAVVAYHKEGKEGGSR